MKRVWTIVPACILALSAELWNRMRRFEEARVAAEAALSIDGTLLEGFVALGDALAGDGDAAAADSVWAAGLALRPDSEAVRARLRSRRTDRAGAAPAG